MEAIVPGLGTAESPHMISTSIETPLYKFIEANDKEVEPGGRVDVLQCVAVFDKFR